MATSTKPPIERVAKKTSQVHGTNGGYGTIDKGPRLRVEVYASEFNGKDYLHVREHYLSDIDSETWLPSKKGITLREGIQIEELITALQAALGDF